MKTIIRLAGIMILLWAAGLADNPQESQADHAVVSFSNPAKPGTVEVDISEGSIRARGYEGTGLTVEEEENVIQVEVEEGKRAVDLLIQVPFSTSLRLSCRDDERGVTVQGVNGEIEVDTSDGPIG